MHVLSLDLERRTDLPPFQAPRWLPPDIPCHRVRAWDEELPESVEPYTHLIASGSTCSVLDDHPFVAPTLELIRQAVALRRPVLGICYGHQLIARALLGRAYLRRAERPEMGWLPVRVLPRGRQILAGLPDPFRVFVGHYDEVFDLPEGWETIAETEHCAVHGFVNEELRVLGFQFHPEMDVEVGNTCFATTRSELEADGFDVDAILSGAREDGSGRILIPRFLELPWPD